MASNYVFPFEEMLKCGVCNKRIKDARSLPCGHTYCKKCIDGTVRAGGRLPCHLQSSRCRLVQLPPNGAEALPKCFAINGLFEDIGKILAEGDVPRGSQIKDSFSCSICMKLMRDARLLSCGHSFCSSCLLRSHQAAQGSTIKCGVCRGEHALPWTGVNDLPPSYRINNIVDVLRDNGYDTDTDRSSQPTGPTRPGRRVDRVLVEDVVEEDDVEEEKRRARSQIQIFVRLPNGKTVTIDITADDTIETLMKTIEAIVNFDPSQQYLTYNGRNLDQRLRTLRFYGIRNCDTIFLNARNRGGI